MSAADFTTGQAARLVIGQTTFTSQDPNSSDTIVGGVSGLAYAADTLFVADSNRVGATRRTIGFSFREPLQPTAQPHRPAAV